MATEKITKAQKQAWVGALRSGEYRQAFGLLRTSEGSYCCLGVACEVWGIPLPSNFESHGPAYDRLDSLLGYNVRERLVDMNDWGGKVFAEIADYIEEHVDAV